MGHSASSGRAKAIKPSSKAAKPTPKAKPTRPRKQITLLDRLSRLTIRQASQLLGPHGEALLWEGGKYEIDFADQVKLTKKLFQLHLPPARVRLTLGDTARHRLRLTCSQCSEPCSHCGAALALILEEKMALGLAAPPKDRVPLENLSEEELVERAIRERAERGQSEKMTVRSLNRSDLWTDYTATSKHSGKTYRVALRGWNRGESFCSCPDFRKNTLGTCKHIEHVLRKVRQRFPAALRNRPYRRKNFSLYIHYGRTAELYLGIPEILDATVRRVVAPLADRPITDLQDLLRRLHRLETLEHPVTIYPDAEELIEHRLFRGRIERVVAEIRLDPEQHRLRKELLRVELLPYQLDGVAFAAGMGRAILADDMGLGKTIQALGVAELLALEANISRVLVICPASLKAQWRSEIHRFSPRPCRLILGSAADRALQYEQETFFTICNYEQVLRDVNAIERVPWDLIILDEGQRIKNWEAKTARLIKSLSSPFALVLTGTPLENRLEELYSIIEFIDDRRLGPAFRFLNHHRVVDERGKVLGYKNLDEIRRRLQPVLLRRTRGTVMQELPPRSTEIIRITPTQEQLEIHGGQMRVVNSIVNKAFLNEMDLLRLQKALLMCRMAANSTFLVDKVSPGYSSKLDELNELLARLAQEEDRKIVIFSEWTTMLDLVTPLLVRHDLRHVRLDGSVPQSKRQQLVAEFQNTPQCRVFLSSNAGATGLNLQAANTVINLDLPWNPALLEQRIARAHRMGQKQPVQVFLLITEDTLEENLLGTLSAKHQLSLAALDSDSNVDQVQLQSGIEELKRRLEVLLGTQPDAPLDASEQQRTQEEALRLAHQKRLGTAGGEFLGAAFTFLSELLPIGEESEESERMGQLIRQRLEDSVEHDEEGRPQLTLTLPDNAALDQLAKTLAQWAVGGQSKREAT